MNILKTNESLRKVIKVPETPRFIPKYQSTRKYHSYSFYADGKRQESKASFSRRLEKNMDEMEIRRVTMHV